MAEAAPVIQDVQVAEEAVNRLAMTIEMSGFTPPYLD